MALFDDPMGFNAEAGQALTSLASESPVQGEIPPPAALPSGAGGGFLSSGAYSVPTPKPSTDWGAIISKVGQAITAGGAGFAGNPNYLETVKRTEIAAMEEQRRAAEDEQRLQLAKLSSFPKIMAGIAELSVSTPEQLDAASKSIAKMVNGAYGTAFDPDYFKHLLSDKNAMEYIKQTAPDLVEQASKLPPAELKRLTSNTEAFKLWTTTQYKQAADEAVMQLSGLMENAKAGGNQEDLQKLKELNPVQASRHLPGVKFLTEDQLAQLKNIGYDNFKTKAMITKESDAAAGGGGTKTMTGYAELLFKKSDLKDLTEQENKDLLAYMSASSDEKELINLARQKNPNASISELLAGARAGSREQKINLAVNIAGGQAQAREVGAETGRQSVLASRLDRITKEAEAGNAGRPLDPTTLDRVGNLLGARRQTAVVEANFSPEFLGPVKGTQAAFEARRRVGSYVGTPLGQQETTFRQSLADIKDMLLRARSGAQINEQEYARLSQMLPAATDEETVFKAGLSRFDLEMKKIIEDRIGLAQTPRGKLSATTPSAPTVIKGKSLSGKPIYSTDGGKSWLYGTP